MAIRKWQLFGLLESGGEHPALFVVYPFSMLPSALPFVARGTYHYLSSAANDLGEMLFSIPPNNTGTFYVSDVLVVK